MSSYWHTHDHSSHCSNQHQLHAHTHAHDHTVGLGTEDPNAEANKRYFDGKASTYDDQAQAVALARSQSQELLKMYPFDKSSTSVMDYACGTGLISRELAPYVKSILGVDISQGMVDQYNKLVSNQGLPVGQMEAVCTELKGQEGELDGRKFDVVVCAAAYHHFTSVDAVTRTLAFFLKPGGSLIVLDRIKPENVSNPEDLIPEHARHIVPHTHAFSEEDMQSFYQNAGFEEFIFRKTGSTMMGPWEVDLFIAKGTKRQV